MIIQNNEDALRVKCEDVKTEEISDLILVLENELNNSARLGNPGIGLAAPQIGIAKNIAIVRLGQHQVNLVNAKIEHLYNPFIFREEGCLSFPGKIEDTKRFSEVHIVDNLVFNYNFIATGLLAVVIQHELDHLNSTLFMDHKIHIKKKVGPNDPCICGKIDISSRKIKKYKKCCGK